ncbi:MAG: hypothetical protein QOG49_1389 [Frankiaceae bacterium]|nr:hypothetical protein [Frankiaceae bacterium]
MVNQLTCAQFRELAPELVFGLLDGTDRAEALAHVTGCADCRAYVAELSRTADALLLIGPEAEPPPGFEAAAVARIRGERRRTAGRRWPAVTAVAAAIALVALALGMFAGRASAPTVARDNRVRHAALVGANGRPVGEVFLHQDGSTSWCYVQFAGPPQDSVYDVRATMRDGRIIAIERFAAPSGRGSYGRSLPVAADDIVEMTLQSTDGRWSYWADLSA